MAAGRDSADESRWPALFRRSRDPIFILNRRRRVMYVNPAFEALAQVTLNEIRGLVCSPRSSAHAMGPLGLTLAPPNEVMDGFSQQIRRAHPGADRGPPWWDISFLPLGGEENVLGIVGRIRVVAAKDMSDRRSMPVAWSQLRSQAQQRVSPALWDQQSTALRRVLQQARLAAASGCPTTIVGEIGVGKQTLARTIHALGSRRELPFVGLDCHCLPTAAIRQVINGPLGFGKPTTGGTIYLHDPASLPRELQQEVATLVGDYPQLIVGCPVDPQFDMQANRLIQPLLSACGIMTIALPPLRDRLNDLPNFFVTFLKQAGDVAPGRSISQDVIDLLQKHTWPGNLDELSRLATELLAKCGPQPILASDLPFAFRSAPMTAGTTKSLALDQLLERVETRLIQQALEKAKGNKSRAAELLGVWRPRLLRRIEALGLSTAEDE